MTARRSEATRLEIAGRSWRLACSGAALPFWVVVIALAGFVASRTSYWLSPLVVVGVWVALGVVARILEGLAGGGRR